MSKDNEGRLWEVFIRTKPGAAFKHAGSLHAFDEELAILNARDLYSRRKEGTAIWVVEAENIVASQPEDVGSFFDPANDKVYRHPTFYELPEGLKHM